METWWQLYNSTWEWHKGEVSEHSGMFFTNKKRQCTIWTYTVHPISEKNIIVRTFNVTSMNKSLSRTFKFSFCKVLYVNSSKRKKIYTFTHKLNHIHVCQTHLFKFCRSGLPYERKIMSWIKIHRIWRKHGGSLWVFVCKVSSRSHFSNCIQFCTTQDVKWHLRITHFEKPPHHVQRKYNAFGPKIYQENPVNFGLHF